MLKPLLLSVLIHTCLSLPSCSDAGQPDFDYVVVGAGAGGGPVASRLAEAGFSVLVVDAGHDVNNFNTTIPLFFGRAADDTQLELNYTLNEYPVGFRIQRNDSWYPRARSIGGSVLHNALINIIADTKSDFDDLASMFKDPTWSRDNMQNYFKRIENNQYLVSSQAPDHGFGGWLKTNLNPDLATLDPKFLDNQIAALSAALNLSGPSVPDLNSRAGVDALGVNLPSFTMDEHHNRSSVRERLLAVEQSSAGRLSFLLDTLATKILLCDDEGGNPTAFGVEVAPGAALAVASNFKGKSTLTTRKITARREVIVSAGIGEANHLSQHGIEPIVNLPGVGNNLQDHDEISTIWRMKQNFSLYDGCTFLSDPKDDPCLQFWIDSGHLNLYSFGGTVEGITSKSSPELAEPDILTYFAPAFFRGFFRGFAQEFADNHNAVTAIALKAHPSSRGTVRLTGSHPQDRLDIQKQRFQAERGPQDVADMREAIKRARGIMANPAVAAFVDQEVFPGPQAQTDEQIEDHIYQNAYGHHACCTNPMGPDHDGDAVLDGDFRVRGVNNLRVVDASSWPAVPGYFITTPIYMISEKAADVIIAAAMAS